MDKNLSNNFHLVIINIDVLGIFIRKNKIKVILEMIEVFLVNVFVKILLLIMIFVLIKIKEINKVILLVGIKIVYKTID